MSLPLSLCREDLRGMGRVRILNLATEMESMEARLPEICELTLEVV